MWPYQSHRSKVEQTECTSKTFDLTGNSGRCKLNDVCEVSSSDMFAIARGEQKIKAQKGKKVLQYCSRDSKAELGAATDWPSGQSDHL